MKAIILAVLAKQRPQSKEQFLQVKCPELADTFWTSLHRPRGVVCDDKNPHFAFVHICDEIQNFK